MPIPKPQTDETQDDFMNRCMGDDVMKSEFPDNDQRLAVCSKTYEDKDKEKEEDSMKMIPIERRRLREFEVRVAEKGEPRFVGYAAVFNELSEDFGGFREKVLPGAFTDSIGTDDVRMLFNHDPNYVLARNKSGTLKLKEDNHGLYYEAIPPNTQWAKDLLESVKRGDISQNSFGFIVPDDGFEYDSKTKTRSLKKAKLLDVSIVTYPAYTGTRVEVRGNVFNFKSSDAFLITKPDPTAVIVDKDVKIINKKDFILLDKAIIEVHALIDRIKNRRKQ